MSVSNESLPSLALKAFEARVRRMARRQGLSVLKRRKLDGYMIVDGGDRIVAGGAPAAYSLQLIDIQQFLEGSYPHG